MHEQSETIGGPLGWMNVFGRRTPQAGQPLQSLHPYEQDLYPTSQAGVQAAARRSRDEGTQRYDPAGPFPGQPNPVRERPMPMPMPSPGGPSNTTPNLMQPPGQVDPAASMSPGQMPPDQWLEMFREIMRARGMQQQGQQGGSPIDMIMKLLMSQGQPPTDPSQPPPAPRG